MQHRWMKFWPQDWRADPALRSVGLAARGLWIEMIGLMHEARPYGHLVINGRPMTPRQLASNVGISEGEAASLLAELEASGVFSRTEEGIIFSRRMVKDADQSEAGREAVSRRWNAAKPAENQDPNRGGNRVHGSPPDSLEAEEESYPVPSLRSGTGSSKPPAGGSDAPALDGEEESPIDTGDTPGLFSGEVVPICTVRRRRSAVPDEVLHEMLAAWNEEAVEHGVPQATKLTPERRTKLLARIRSRGWADDPVRKFRAYVRHLLADPFNRGEGARGWRATLDYAVRSDEIVQRTQERYAAEERRHGS